MSTELQIVEGTLVVSGVFVLFAYLMSSGRAAWRCAASGSEFNSDPVPAHSGIRPEHVALPMLAFLMVHTVVLSVLAPSPSGSAGSELNSDPGAEVPADLGLLANLTAQAAGGAVCILLARSRFAGGLRGFLLGPTPWVRSLLWAAGGLLAVLPLCWLSEWLSTLLLRSLFPGFEPPAHEVLELLQRPDLPWWLAPLLWLGAVAIAPLAEESFFRGLFQNGLKQFIRPVPAAVAVAALLFGLAHVTLLHAILPLTVLGFVLGHVYERTGALLAPLVLHALFNLKAMLYTALSA